MEPLGSKRILVIEHEAEELRFIQHLLGRTELDLITAETAVAGARLLRTPPLPDLVVLDLALSDVSGVEFLKQMRAKPQFDTVPVIVLADATRPLEIRAALVAGADRYVAKSYMGNNLLKTALEVLRSGRVSAPTDG